MRNLDFLQNFAIEISHIVIAVVGQLTFQQQKFLNSTRQKFLNRNREICQNKDLFIIHNLMFLESKKTS